MLIAQISDMHLTPKGHLVNGVVDTVTCFSQCVERIKSLNVKPDLIAFTGDLTESGQLEEYLELKKQSATLSVPYYFIPGNHDDRNALRQAFPEHAYLHREEKFIQFVVETVSLRLIFLDTLDPGVASGLLDSERLNWLRQELNAAPKSRTILFMHHPPFATGIHEMDEINCQGSEALLEIISAYPCIERICCGHVHRFIESRWANIPVCVAPSCAHQIELDLRPKSPLAFNLEPPGFLLHLWQPNSGLITHHCFIGSYPGPYNYG